MADTSHLYTRDELLALGVAEVGENVAVDRSCRLFGAANIWLGHDVRIDVLCVLSAGGGEISLGNYVHLGAGAKLFGSGGIVMEDFSGLSAGVCVFSATDDYSGASLTNPTVPAEFRNVKSARVVLGRHAIVGCNSVLLPGVTLGLGAAVGALTLVRKSVPDFVIVSGNPVRRIGRRSETLLELERAFLARQSKSP